MSLTDPIGDMIARIKNAQVRNHKKVQLPSSNFKVNSPTSPININTSAKLKE